MKRIVKVNDPSFFQYEYHSLYKSSLFMNTAGLKEERFIILDYEVYTHMIFTLALTEYITWRTHKT